MISAGDIVRLLPSAASYVRPTGMAAYVVRVSDDLCALQPMSEGWKTRPLPSDFFAVEWQRLPIAAGFWANREDLEIID